MVSKSVLIFFLHFGTKSDSQTGLNLLTLAALQSICQLGPIEPIGPIGFVLV